MRLIPAFLLCSLLLGCRRPFPVHEREALIYSRAEDPIPPDDTQYNRTLQIRWMGTMCHLIQLGDVSVLTDPYFTHFPSSEVAYGTIASDPQTVRRWTADLPKPNAIFIGHSHYDHMLDLVETVRQRNWQGVPIYAGPTAANILAGYGEGHERNVNTPQTDSGWIEINGPQLEYRAFCAKHAPQLPGISMFPGQLASPRTSPPTRARDFPEGETFTYLFRFRGTDDKQFTVFVASSATDGDMGIPDDVPEGVDVAILCVPGWSNVRGYPDEVIHRLHPRVILLAHLDNFLREGWGRRELVPEANLHDFLIRTRRLCDYPRFERIVLTDMGSTVRVSSSPNK